MPKFIDITGKTFGKWFVIEKMNYKDNRGQILWLCECSCENKTRRVVKGGALTSGKSTNCGCERIKKLIENSKLRKKYNKYEIIDNETMIGYASNTNNIFYFDSEDYEKIKDFCWWENNWGYLYTTKPNTNRRTNMLLHRYILDYDGKKEVDHKNRNRKDNRKSNLRIVASEDNNRNMSISFDNISGIIGVDWAKRLKRWRSRIVYKGTAYHLGVYTNKSEAIIARLRAELQYFGKEFAPQRHLFNEYDIE